MKKLSIFLIAAAMIAVFGCGGGRADGVITMTTSAKEIASAVNHVNEMSKKTQEHIQTLFHEVSKFKVA